jgi:hypothetical protein
MLTLELFKSFKNGINLNNTNLIVHLVSFIGLGLSKCLMVVVKVR